MDWNVRTHFGESPLTIAVDYSRVECLEILLSVPDPLLDLGVTDRHGRNIAQLAVSPALVNGGDRTKKCLELLSGDQRAGKYWNTRNGDGDTPLMHHIKYSLQRISLATAVLVNPSLDLDIVDSDGLYLEDIAR